MSSRFQLANSATGLFIIAQDARIYCGQSPCSSRQPLEKKNCAMSGACFFFSRGASVLALLALVCVCLWRRWVRLGSFVLFFFSGVFLVLCSGFVFSGSSRVLAALSAALGSPSAVVAASGLGSGSGSVVRRFSVGAPCSAPSAVVSFVFRSGAAGRFGSGLSAVSVSCSSLRSLRCFLGRWRSARAAAARRPVGAAGAASFAPFSLRWLACRPCAVVVWVCPGLRRPVPGLGWSAACRVFWAARVRSRAAGGGRVGGSWAAPAPAPCSAPSGALVGAARVSVRRGGGVFVGSCPPPSVVCRLLAASAPAGSVFVPLSWVLRG